MDLKRILIKASQSVFYLLSIEFSTIFILKRAACCILAH
ncbi:hypothetical protein J504_0981 [Acinetobacter baumannii 348935]|nr:hypothetical protein J504_0981 [Acinetobacter baumannii 348935]